MPDEHADAPVAHPEGPQPPSALREAAEPVPLTREELARIRAAAEAEQQEGGHVCLTPALCQALLDRLGALEAALDDILPFAEGVERQTRSEYGAIISWETELQAILRRARAALGREEASRA